MVFTLPSSGILLLLQPATKVLVAVSIMQLPLLWYFGLFLSIDMLAFSQCKSLESIDFPSSIETIGYSAFSNCVNLSSITLPETVVNVHEKAFGGCKNLNEIKRY